MVEIQVYEADDEKSLTFNLGDWEICCNRKNNKCFPVPRARISFTAPKTNPIWEAIFASDLSPDCPSDQKQRIIDNWMNDGKVKYFKISPSKLLDWLGCRTCDYFFQDNDKILQMWLGKNS